jgi:hypothetical protein
MSETESLFAALRQAADPDVAGAVEQLVREAPDHALCRINALDFAGRAKLDEEHVITGLLHATRLGLFDLLWNILCPSCGGVIDTNPTLKTVTRSEYRCAFCAAGYEPILDEVVEVTFTVNPRLREIAAHHPETLPLLDYYRQIFWSSGIDLPPHEALAKVMEEVTLETVELPPGDKAILSLALPLGLAIVFDPVTHCAQFIEVKGEVTRERQSLAMLLDRSARPRRQCSAQGRSGSTSRTARICARCPPCGSRDRSLSSYFLGENRISRRSACSPIRRSATFIAPTRSMSNSGSRSPASRSCSRI